MDNVYELSFNNHFEWPKEIQENYWDIPVAIRKRFVEEYHANDKATFFMWYDESTGFWRAKS